MKQQLVDDLVKEIGEFLFKRSYPKTSLTQIFKKFPEMDETCRALAILEGGGMIRLNHNKGESIFLANVEILDSKGEPIRHAVIQDNPDSPVFGNWFYDASGFCINHDLANENCLKCQQVENSRICVNHKRVISKCDRCKEATRQYKILICDELSHEDFINLSIQQHKKMMLEMRGL